MKHPVWLAGFRPFFILAFISGAVLPWIWVLLYLGKVTLPSRISPLQWHAHEMLFGFGWAVLGGFLLTASKNWVKIRGLHGLPLACCALLWISERATLAFFPVSGPLAILTDNAFLLSVASYVFWSLVRYRKQDSFRDNWFFLLALPLFLLAKNLLLLPEYFSVGWSLSIGLFRVAFAVMFERTLPQFMKNRFHVDLEKSAVLNLTIKILILASAFEAFLPAWVAAALLFCAGGLWFYRGLRWKPLVGIRDFGIAIMYWGYFGLALHLILEGAKASGLYAGIGALSVHAFTFLCMGIVIPGMMIRISQGHTGRPLHFTISDRIALSFMFAAGFFRLVVTQVFPEHYTLCVAVAGAGWSLCFIVLGIRLIPFLLRPRIDGREH